MGRRLAENCLRTQREDCEFHGLDAEVVEAACLAHDLGHPPFGHIGEYELKALLLKEDEGGQPLDLDGYEGNAQSFRIVTKLAIRHSQCDGLDLTRATLAALLKYPWRREPTDENRTEKWGYYRAEQDDFDFAFEGLNEGTRTLEAELMDWADDIAYSVHDLEDFHRCNFVPWARLFGGADDDMEEIVTGAAKKWHDAPVDAEGRLRAAYRRVATLFTTYRGSVLIGPYEGTRAQRLAIRTLTSTLVGRYVTETHVVPEAQYDPKKGRVLVDPELLDEVRILKRITQHYVLSSPALAAQQKGQTHILRALFYDFLEEIQLGKPRVLPKRFHHFLEMGSGPYRVAADCVASLTEGEAVALYQRLRGLSGGSVLDPIVR